MFEGLIFCYFDIISSVNQMQYYASAQHG